MASGTVFRLSLLTFLCYVCNVGRVLGFSNDRSDNVVAYWGQDSAGQQQTLSFYCQDDAIDVFPMAFLYIFFGEGGQPVIDLANICSKDGNSFPGTELADCSFLQSDIEQCQANGKLVTLSLGGATSQVGFDSDDQASSFAETIWNMFLGGNSDTRPFGNAVLDGIDLDIENGSPAHYATFVNKIRSLANGASKQYYVTAAPQCPFPDANVGDALNGAPFDAVYVQFYNNYCEVSAPSEFNFDTWDNWAKTQSPNPDIKVYLGVPGSGPSAGDGYVDIDELISVAQNAQSRYSSFGGVMMWDADSAHTNGRYDLAIKNAIRSGPGSTSTPTTSRSSATQSPTTQKSSATASSDTTSSATASSATTTTATSDSVPTSTFQSATSTVSHKHKDPHATARVKRPNGPFQRRNEATPTVEARRSRFFRL